ncbi:MAG: metallophosphoesterase family protein [Burkholderiales bacterium]
MPGRETRVGLLSDTHGLLRPEALEFLRGSDVIVHAGDIGDPAVLDTLRTLAPVTAVRGNNDRDAWARAIAETQVLEAGGVVIYVLHDLAELDLDPAAAGFRVVVSGHSHQPRIEERGGVLYVNPGSCGPRRFKLPIAAGELQISGGSVSATLLEIQTRAEIARVRIERMKLKNSSRSAS